MMKLLLLALVIAVAVWMVTSRRRKPPAPGGKDKPTAGKPPTPTPPMAMLACAHCGVHLPKADAAIDAAGRPYCSDAHRLAGPR